MKAKLRTKITLKKATTTVSICEFKIEPLKSESIKDLYQRRLSTIVSNNKILDTDDVDNAWIKLSTNILKAAEESVGKGKININRKNNKSKP